MSYILEALKMSEQSRRQSAGAMPLSLLPAVEEELEPTRSWRHYLLGGVLAINALGLALWLRPAAPDGPPTATPKAMPAAVAAAPVAATPPPAAPSEIKPVAAVAEPPPAPVAVKVELPKPAAPIVVAKIEPPAPVPPRAAVQPPAARTPSSAEPRPAKTAAKPEAAPEPQAAPPLPDGMPVQVSKQLPPIVLAGYIQDSDAKMVIVNDRLLREGDEVSPGLTLERILDGGVVFNFKGYRFKR